MMIMMINQEKEEESLMSRPRKNRKGMGGQRKVSPILALCFLFTVVVSRSIWNISDSWLTS